MNRFLLIIFALACLIVPAYAGTSTSYQISLEVFPDGGGDQTSVNHALRGNISGMAYGSRAGKSYNLGEGFINAVYPVTTTEPVITSISPSAAQNNGPVNVAISGINFAPGATVKLYRSGFPDITGESVVVMDSTRMTCTFDITGLTTGVWSLEIVNPNGRIAILGNAFNITESSKKVDIIGTPINYPNPFNPDAAPTKIKFKLTADAPIMLYIHNINGVRIWEKQYPSGSAGGKAGVNEVLWDGYTVFSEEVSNGIYVYQITSGGRTLATGKIAVFR